MTEPSDPPVRPHFQLPELEWSELPSHLHDRIGFSSTWRCEPADASQYGFNLGLHVGDNATQVVQRRLAVAAHYGISPVWMKQVHGTTCALAGNANRVSGQAAVDGVTADAAFTQTVGVAPLIMTADCLPILLVDEHGVGVAAVHCGWRGLLDGAIETTLAMFDRQGLGRDGLHAWLGPCIGEQSFEVGEEVHAAFVRKNASHAQCFSVSPTGVPGKWLADLRSLAVQTLTLHRQVSISIDRRDTLLDDRLYSFRRNPVTGRQASLIWIKP